jgi:hypothetical protein
MASALRGMLGIEAKLQQRILMAARDESDIAAAPAIAAARTAARDVLLAPEREAAVAAVPCLHRYFSFIDQHLFSTLEHKKGRRAARGRLVALLF